MADNRTQELFTFANLHIAAEAFLDVLPASSDPQYRERLVQALRDGNGRASRFPVVLAEEFADTFEIIAHRENTPTGFSGTLFRSKVTDLARGLYAGQYTLSFRSTEFVDDAIRDATGTGDLEVRQLGWALGQIADMEAWYQELKAAGALNANEGLPPDLPFNVTGYSLGGHLATAFAVLRRDEARFAKKESTVASVYTFNGAGTGGIRFGNELGAIVQNFHRERSQAAGTVALTRKSDIGSALDRVNAIVSEFQRLSAFSDKAGTFLSGQAPPLGDMARGAYQLAALAASRWTTPSASFGNPLDSVNLVPLSRVFARAEPFENMTEIFGAEGGESGTSLVDKRFSFVAFSGQHYSNPESSFGVYIEDQPLERGNYVIARDRGKLLENPSANSFADTHSLVLLIDSLALMSAMTKLDPSLTQGEIESILKAASNSKATSIPGAQGEAEGDSLERILDALRRIFVGPGASSTPAPLTGNAWHDVDVRQVFHANIEELTSSARFQAWAGRVRLKLLPSSAVEIRNAAREDVAYRYALRELSDFTVTGAPGLYDEYNQNGELEIFDPATGRGALTAEYLSDRAAMLANAIDMGNRNAGVAKLQTSSVSIKYSDAGAGDVAYVFDILSGSADSLPQSERGVALSRLFENRVQQNKGRKVLFGFEGNAGADPNTRSGGRDELQGSALDDRLYGGGGNDTLRGNEGKDHLQGDTGEDRLIGGAEDDALFGGKGNDILNGGLGIDKYYFYTGGGADEVFDVAEGSAGARRQLGEIYLNDVRVAGTFAALDEDKKNFRLGPVGDAYFAVYQGDLATTTPGRLVLFKETDGSNVVTLNNFVSGDFGIVLDPNAPQRQYTDKFGTPGSDNDNLSNVPHASSIGTDAADQRVFGLAGADYMTVAHANTQGFGGPDNDYMQNGEADQQLYGEAGRDVLLASAGDDSLYGGTEDDALQGGADRDYLEGNEGNDVLDGGAGEDVLAGGDGHDFIFGGGSVTVPLLDWDAFASGTLGWGAFDADGNVLIRGLAGLSNIEGDAADVITGGSGNDWIFAGDGNDAVAGDEDNDYLVGQAGNDEVSGGEGADTLYGDGAQGDLSEAPGSFSVFTFPEFHGKDSLSGGAGNDFISGDGEADELYGGADNDTLVGDSANVADQFHGADYLDGGDGNDVLIGYGKDDTLFGGAGDDNLGGDSSTIADSTHGADYLDGEDGADVLHGDGGADTLFGGAGDDTLDGDASNVAFEFHGDDYLEGEEGNDALQGGGGSDRLFGGDGNDSLAGDGAAVPVAFAGDDYLDGEAGSDILEGGAGNDTLTGGAGVDTLMGGAGDDLYLVQLGSQNDFIQDVEGVNTVRMGAPVTFAFQALGSDGKAYLGLRYSSSDIVHIQEGLTNNTIRTELSDGTVRTATDWRANFNQFVFVGGSSGADTLAGSALAEVFNPGAGSDTILFDRGSGFDRVSGFAQTGTQGFDKVQLGENIAAADLVVRRDINGHLTLTIRDSGDVLRLDNWGAQAAAAHSGIQVQFDGGGGLTAADLIALSLAPTEANDILAGGNADEAIFGGTGNDNLGGGAGADTLIGGVGDDRLFGQEGADTYVFGVGDGNDTLIDTGADVNVVQLGTGITPAEVTLNQGSIVVTLNTTGDTLTIADWYREESSGPKFAVQELRFADGTTWDAGLINENANHATPFGDLLRGIDIADTLYGLSGDDTLEGFSGDDVLVGGDGNDVLDGGSGADDLDGGVGNDTLKGGSNGDVLDGGPGDDTLDGGGGENVFYVGEGHDFVIATADDTLVFGPGVEAAGVIVSKEGALQRFEFASGSVRLSSPHLVREVRFADGTVWSRDDLASRLPPVEPPSPPGGSIPPLPGLVSDDTLAGTPGNDLLAGGFGSDTYVFGYGSGNDTIQDALDVSPPNYTQAITGERDRILFAPGVGPEDVLLDFDGTGDEFVGLFESNDTLTIRNPFGDTLGRVELIEFADGTVWDLGRLRLAAFASPGGSARHFGTVGSDAPALGADDALYFGLGGNDSLTDLSGHNTLYGDEANDTFSGGSGDDVFIGGAGNDTFTPRSGDNVIHFGRGAGQDTLGQQRQANDRGSDTVVFAQDVRPEHVRLRRGPNATLIVELAGTPDSLTIRDDFFSDRGRARLRFQFADGTLWDAAQIEANIQLVALIEGGTGANSLVGGDGVDLFVGGPGNDTLTGGGGQDTFVFARGDGVDTVFDESPRFVLGEGILPQDVTLSPSNFAAGLRDLVITIAGGGGQITARNWFPSTHAGAIEFADGTVWDSAFIGTRVPYTWVSGATGSYTGTPGNDTFSMGTTADTMRGEGGDDSLSSGGGNDQLFGGAGNDALSAGTGDDSLQGEGGDDTLLGTAGNDWLVGGDGNDLLDAGVETLVSGETDVDTLAGGAGDDLLFGRIGSDALAGDAGNDALEGGAGDDLLEGGPGDDFLDGGTGDDRLYGGSGSDTYRFGAGSGNDTLLDFDATGAAIDTVSVGPGVAPQDLDVTQAGGDLVLRLLPSGDRLTIRSFGRPDCGVERIVFAGGTTWDAFQIAAISAAQTARERADVIFGSTGDDALAGLGGDDIIDGGAGADLLDGGSGDDVLIGGAGDDTLTGGAGFDHLTGGEGTDIFVVTVDSGSDAIADLGTGDTLSIGPGISPADVTVSRDRDHLFLEAPTGEFITLENWFANGANGTVAFSDGTQWDGAFLEATVDAATERDDFLVGSNADDGLAALAGLDTVLAGSGNDLVLGGEGSDTIHGEAGDDTLAGESGYDLLKGGDGDDSLDGGTDDDGLFGDAGNDTLFGGEGFDDLAGGAGDDMLSGGEGDDALAGDDGTDLLDGGVGDDMLDGGPGNDVYVYAAGSGSDTITESGSTISTADVLRFSGLLPSDVGFRRFTTHTVLELAGSAETLTLQETNFPTSLVIESVEFEDGTIWNQGAIALQTINVGTEGNDFLSGFKGLMGLGGNDTLVGGPTDSVLDGGTGNDMLIGGAGNDTYVFGRGYGEDTISNFDATSGRVDVLAFAQDVAPQDVVLVERVGNQLRLHLDGGVDRVRVDNWFVGPDYGLSEARFADGTVWSAADIEVRIAVAAPTESDDVLIGLTGDDTIDGLGGNDRLEGGPGDDTLIGNAGDDTLLGGSGNDVYVFGPGAGNDAISDTDATAGNVDAVLLDAFPGEVTVSQLFPHLVLTLAGGERLTLLDWFSGDAQKVEEVRFSGGTVWDVATLSTRSIVPLVGTAGADFLVGTSGADTIEGLGGNDFIRGDPGSDTLSGGDGNDVLIASSGNDILDGGSGNDTLNGDIGNDTYRFSSGYGLDTISEAAGTVDVDVVEFNGLASDVTARRVGANLELSLASGDKLVAAGWFTGQQVELVRFADGTAWDVAMLDTLAYADLPHVGTGLADTLFGTNDADTLEGLEGNDRLEGRGGNDVLAGGTGNDTLFGGGGDDVYRFAPGDGFDTVFEEQSGFDMLEFGIGIAPADVTISRSGDTVFLSVLGGAGQVALGSWANAFTSAFRLEEVRFADGTIWDEHFLFDAARPSAGADFIRLNGNGESIDALMGNDVVLGGPGDDVLIGSDGDDTLSGEGGADLLGGGPGRDLLQGGLGDDQFAFAPGTGTDWITDSGGIDQITFAAGMTASGVVFTRDLSNLFVASGADRFTLVDWFSHPDSRIESFRFSDGTVLSEGDVRSLIRPGLPTSLNDTIFGSNAGETIFGSLGEDALYGEGGSDTLDGQSGSDYMLGGPGDDIYHVDIRLDRVTEDAGEGTDTVITGVGYVLPANVENLTLSGVAAVNGTGNALDNIIIGNPAANVLDGGAGDDSLRGGAGNDAYLIRPAEGSDEVVDFDPAPDSQDAVRFNAGIAPAQVRVSRIEDDIRLRIAGGGEVVLRNWFDPAYRIEAVTFADGTVWDAPTIELLSALPPNRPPELSAPIPDLSTLEDAPFAFALPPATFVDPDPGDTLSYSASLADGSALPAWLLFDAAEATFSGTPANADVGLFDILLAAQDAWGEIASDTFRIEVQNVNDAPLARDDVGAAVEDGGPVALNAADLLANDLDVDAEDTKAIIGLSASAAGATVSLVNGDIVYDAASLFQALRQGATATDAFTYTMADAAGATSLATVNMTVTGANDAPYLVNALEDQVGREAELLSFTLPADAFADVDAGDTLTLAAALQGGSALPSWLEFDATLGAFLGTPDAGDAGTYGIEVTASDASGAHAAGVFELVIANAGGQGETIIGTPDDDVLTGTAFDDFLDGREASDRLFAAAGDDVLAYSKDGHWNGHFHARHSGSPSHTGTGQTESIAGKNRSHDIFDGGDGFDVLLGTGGHDAFFLEDRFSPPDDHDGPRLAGVEYIALGDGHDLVDLTSQRFSYANVVLNGGDGNDVLWASAGSDVLIGGNGNDKLSGAAGGDVYVHGAHDGHDTIDEAGVSGQLDVLRFGEGITQQMVRVSRHHLDLILDIAGPHGSVSVRGWFGSSAKRVESIQFADGSAWGEEEIRERARRSDGVCDPIDNGHGHHDHQHAADDHGRREYPRAHDRDDGRDRFRDQLAEWMGQRLARPPRFDFEELTRRLRRDAVQESSPLAIAEQWQAVARHARALADAPEEDEGSGAAFGPQRFELVRLVGIGATAFGFEGSTGAARGIDELKSFGGLTEGFRRI